MRFTEHDLSSVEEKHICTALIVSTEFCTRIKDYLNLDYFTNSYLKTLSTWCICFYEEHNKAPFKHINDIFESFRVGMKETDAELIDELLTSLGNNYGADNETNADFLVNEAEEYFRRRELEIHVNNISVLKDKGDIEQAEMEIQRFNRVSVKLDESIYINPGDLETRDKIYKKRDEKQRQFFQFPGDLGLFLGNWSPPDVIGVNAPQKKGKSFFLTDIQKHAVLSKLHCLKWSIEMTDVQELERFDKAFFPTVNGEDGIYKFPEFDCMYNQLGTCGERNSTVIVRESEKADLVEMPDHVVCTKCKDSREEHSRYCVTTYKTEILRKEDTYVNIKKGMAKWLKDVSRYSRIVVRPKYSLTYDLMMKDFEAMTRKHNFIPRMLLLDYLDILQIASKFDDYRLDDEKWKLINKIAGATGCLMITPTQGNKESFTTTQMTSSNTSGFYGKGRHVNMMIGINQNSIEKRAGMFRLNIMDSRSSQQYDDDFCVVLQDLRAGQMHLESYWPGKFNFLGRR